MSRNHVRKRTSQLAALPTIEMFSLQEKVAIVTGGNRNIGFALSRGLAGAGAKVLIANRDHTSGEEAALRLQAEGLEVAAVQTDVSDLAACHRMALAALERWGRIDILVNNAGVRVDKTAADHEASDFDWIMSINVRGVLHASQAVYPAMKHQQRGRIINVGSISGHKGVWRRTTYSASKGAVSALSRGLAVEWAQDGITVNTLSPGYIVTSDRPVDPHSPQYRATVDLTPLGRLGTPEDLVGLCVFLASDASAYITGQELLVDGGRSLTIRPRSLT